MSDDSIKAVTGPGDDVIKGSNFPTPMGMAPASPTSQITPSTDAQPQATAAPEVASTSGETTQPAAESTNAES